MCLPHAGYGVLGVALSAAASAPKHKLSSTQQDRLCAFILSQPSLCVPVLTSLSGCLCWPDSVSARRAIALSSRFIPLVLEQPGLHQLFAQIFTAALRNLMQVRVEEAEEGNCHKELIGLVKEIYVQFMRVTDFPRHIMATVPNINLQELQVFEERLLNSNDKVARQVCRQFLEKYVIGIGLPNTKSSELLDLPENLVLSSSRFKDSAPDWKEMNGTALHKLFEEN
eukprot:TRINITY_DN3922_c0_g1_i7.p1 TRINITY_DN3922_c0_g1~~TRINITY_DN3922_c0_g1_i7.p1  ORF type:complete len:226 (+),score=32.17 TRINITY_DN3922_c0_g1_i7:183-860(+)